MFVLTPKSILNFDDQYLKLYIDWQQKVSIEHEKYFQI
jgi:hypothetical protein